MALDSLLMMSIGVNFVQLALYIRTRSQLNAEKERFATYIKMVDKRIAKLESGRSQGRR
jgi:hypothetical protein